MVAGLFVKLSLVVFVRRLYAPDVYVIADRAFLAYMVALVAYFFAGTVAPFLLCTPAAASWDLRVLVLDHARCPHRVTAGIAFTILTALSDVVLLLLAVYKVWFLRVSRRTRAGVIFLLSLGGLSVVCFLWRTVYITTAMDLLDATCKPFPISLFASDADGTKGSETRLTILTVIEINVAIITASLPACSVLFRKMIPKSVRSGSSGRAPGDWSGEQAGEQGDAEKADKVLKQEIGGSYIRESG
jgi:hypothetical protein